MLHAWGCDLNFGLTSAVSLAIVVVAICGHAEPVDNEPKKSITREQDDRDSLDRNTDWANRLQQGNPEQRRDAAREIPDPPPTNAVAMLIGALDDVQVAVSHRVEHAREDRGAGLSVRHRRGPR